MKQKTTNKKVKFLELLFGLFITMFSTAIHAQTFEWVKSMGGNSNDQSWQVATDRNGNVYAAGYYISATADFNAGGTGGVITNAGDYDAFLAKYDAGGNFLWAKSIGGGGTDQGYGVNTDGAGNVYVTGYFQSPTMDLNPGGTGGTITNAGGGNDIFVVKYDAGGNFLWAKDMGGSGDDYGRTVVIDAGGNVYVTGYFGSTTADFNPGGSGGSTLTSAGGIDIFLAK